MHTKEHIEQMITDLEQQKARIMRSFGGRYSRKINGIKYNSDKFKNKGEWLDKTFTAQKRAGKNIKSKKEEIRKIDSEIYKLHRELAKLEMEKPPMHSERFNHEFQKVINSFN